jgi:hypothetical protein
MSNSRKANFGSLEQDSHSSGTIGSLEQNSYRTIEKKLHIQTISTVLIKINNILVFHKLQIQMIASYCFSFLTSLFLPTIYTWMEKVGANPQYCIQAKSAGLNLVSLYGFIGFLFGSAVMCSNLIYGLRAYRDLKQRRLLGNTAVHMFPVLREHLEHRFHPTISTIVYLCLFKGIMMDTIWPMWFVDFFRQGYDIKNNVDLTFKIGFSEI